MVLIITCALVAGLVFTPPEGYTIEKVEGPAKVERKSEECPNCVTLETGFHAGPSKVKLFLRQTGKAGNVIELQKGCTGEERSIQFKSGEN